MEILIAVLLVTLAAAGIGLGLMLGRGPVRTSCAAAEGLAIARCADCPLQHRTRPESDR
ncbi:hypothetical protein [Roseivivax sediminis]|uniref:Uncharacterized protein n=1 Tax=Roseivivax sediminis TaxID=936889 RepID=A0A1I1VDB1_9RHOB|nr:hypothetical protein [Roseivivax sediminis]SFD79958.1 hypothetical protein SAMN04515678_10392 [Roseivivax sediminis]